MAFFAHSDKTGDFSLWQPLETHLKNVSNLASGFASCFSSEAGAWGEAAGLLHDLGKYSDPFQQRLRGGPSTDHSTAGAKEAVELFGDRWGRLLAYALAGHHGGLPDAAKAGVSSLEDRLAKQVPTYAHFPPDLLDGLDLPIPELRGRDKEGLGFHLSFFLRMVYSCLVDADFLDTEAFMDPAKAGWRGGRPALSQLWPLLERRLDELRARAGTSSLNARRNDILAACLHAAPEPPGLFSLTVPTGGGKTIASLAFALRHAMEHELERIIYVIPYTSIIEQNAKVFREAFGELGQDAVLEHHSNLAPPPGKEGEDDPAWRRYRLAAENWDAPVVVTTNVQFFESLFANRPSRCRKLHNLAKSVVILDEAQMLPLTALKPCLEALQELVTNYRATVVLCTATQPAFSDTPTLGRSALNAREIAPDPPKLYEEFRRVEAVQEGKLSRDELASRLAAQERVLCIVNTRRQARELFTALREKAGAEGCHHLSALMYPAHRSEKIAEIKEAALAQGRPCRVVSTTLIEAGVDVSFPMVYRALAGIDSLAQAAGRCNREDELRPGKGKLHIYEPEEGLPPGSLRVPAQEADMILRNFPDDPLSLEAVRKYFENLFSQQQHTLDEKGILESLEKGKKMFDFPFAQVAKDFSYFDSPGEAVLICRDEGLRKEIVDGLEHSPHPGRFLRMAQPYTVQLYPHELARLESTGEVRRVGQGLLLVLENLNLYDPDLGLVVEWSGVMDPERSVL